MKLVVFFIGVCPFFFLTLYSFEWDLHSATRDCDELKILFCLPIDKRSNGRGRVLSSFGGGAQQVLIMVNLPESLDVWIMWLSPQTWLSKDHVSNSLSVIRFVFSRFLIAPVYYQMISDTTMTFFVMLGKFHSVLSRVQGSMELNLATHYNIAHSIYVAPKTNTWHRIDNDLTQGYPKYFW